MVEIVRMKREDLDSETVDRICEIMTPIFKEAGIGRGCVAMGFKGFWDMMLSQVPPAALFLLMDDEKIGGLIGGIVFDDPMTEERYAAEVMWRVVPAAQHFGWGMKLLQSFEWWAREQGCKRIVIHGSAGHLEELGEKILPLGYAPYQVEFMKEI